MKERRTMKLLIACALLLSSCALSFGRPTVTREEARDSVFKIYSDVEVDPTPVCEDDADCLAKLKDRIGKTYHFKFIGTAWASGHSKGHTQIATAGHICESDETYKYKILDWGTLTLKTYELPILSVTYDLEASDGTKVKDIQVLHDDDDVDACILTAPGDIAPSLPLADRDPDYGEHCFVIGAPAGIWGGGLAMISEATFSGRVSMNGLPQMLTFSGAAVGGSSGSPVICGGRVVGILDRGRREPPFFLAAPWDDVRRDIRAANHLPAVHKASKKD